MSHTLTFTQLVGTFTVDKELVGAQDPYVIFEADGKKCQTKAIKSVGAGSAEWKETYTLKEFSAKSTISSSTKRSSSELEVIAYNHNSLLPDSQIGSGTVDLARLGESQLSGSGDRVTVRLTDKKGKHVGELKFLIHGGGYTGSSSGSGYGTGSGIQGGSQQSSGTRGTGYQESGVDSGNSGSGQYGVGRSTSHKDAPITGVGSGPTEHVAHQAARKAAVEGDDVNIRTKEGVATGHPTGQGYDDSEGQSRGVHGHSRGSDSSSLSGHKASGVRGVDVAAGEVIDRKYYTGTEDRPQEQALVEQFREHNPYAKEYETTVQHTGRERQIGSSIEALGTQERVVDTHHHVHAQPHDLIARALPEGAISERPGGEGWVEGKAGPICDSTKFEVTGDRVIDRERVTNLREHREFEKEFEVKTAVIGEHELRHAAETEQLKRERILLDEKNKIACEGHPTVDIGSGTSSGTGHGHHSHHSGSGITGSHNQSGQTTGSGLAQGVREATSGHGTQGTTGQSGSYGAGQGDSYGSTTTAGQEKGLFQKVKETVTGQPKSGSTY